MSEVAAFVKAEYNINFDKEYEQLLPYFSDNRERNKSARGLDVTISDLAGVLESAGISESSESYNYLVQVSSLFEDEQLTEEQILNELTRLKNQIETNNSIVLGEKEKLLMVSTLLLNNFTEIADNLYTSEGGVAGGRTNGWLQKAWRVVRSVVLTAGVGALVGAAAGPVGAIVGAIVVGAVAITDAAANNYCHFAMQCAGGWRQDCATGVCAPYNP